LLHVCLGLFFQLQPASNFTELDFKPFDGKLRGSSLLRRFEAGKPRNCKTLPIPFQYCICQYDKRQVNDKALKDMLGRFVVEQFNSFLKTQNVSSQCEEYKLHKIDVEQYLSEKVNNADNSTSFFEVTFEVAAPAKGKFQVPVRKELEKLDLGGALFTRLDKYGKNGDCMKNDALKPFYNSSIQNYDEGKSEARPDLPSKKISSLSGALIKTVQNAIKRFKEPGTNADRRGR
ncbi:hypothetical protein ANCCAN_06631, partial [Ancylostoma caninum]